MENAQTERIKAGSGWVEVDLGAIQHNYREIRRRIKPEVKILGVVKADAYGHGAIAISRALEELGVEMLGVTTPEEGRRLRQAGITTPILVFSPFLPEEAASFVDFDLTATIASFEAIHWLGEAAEKRNRIIKVHLKVETGMGRFGFWPEEVVAAAQEIRQTSGLFLEGIYSHLATAMWKNKKYCYRQFGIFRETCEELERAGIGGLLKHMANSAAVLELPEMQLDMVRVGTLLYGQAPVPYMEKNLKLKDSWNLKAKVIYIRKLPTGQTAGYGRTFKASKPVLVAILPLGFVDGIQVEPLLKPANLLDVVKGIAKLVLRYFGYQKLSPLVQFPGGTGRVIGKVGMQLTMVDVSAVQGIAVGTVACLPARRTAIRADIPKVYRAPDGVWQNGNRGEGRKNGEEGEEGTVEIEGEEGRGRMV